MNKRILVIGATGLLGEPVAHALLQEGFTVRLMVRDPKKLLNVLGVILKLSGEMFSTSHYQ